MSIQLQSQALRQEGVRELGAQASPSIRAAPTPAMLMPKERLGRSLSCVWVSLPTEGLDQLGNVGLYCQDTACPISSGGVYSFQSTWCSEGISPVAGS